MSSKCRTEQGPARACFCEHRRICRHNSLPCIYVSKKIFPGKAQMTLESEPVRLASTRAMEEFDKRTRIRSLRKAQTAFLVFGRTSVWRTISCLRLGMHDPVPTTFYGRVQRKTIVRLVRALVESREVQYIHWTSACLAPALCVGEVMLTQAQDAWNDTYRPTRRP